jgi:3-deoxy-D-manno-octulosonic-acid transferase
VAVAPLVKELRRRHPEYRFFVSTVTETGREAVEQRLGGVAEHFYAPLDFPWVVSKVVTRLKPVLYLFVETELWPNLLRILHQRGVPTVMVNGRLSTRSFARQQWGPVRLFYRDVERIIALGADAQVVRRTGNIKFDQPAPQAVSLESIRANLALGDHEQLLIAGSTHSGEEESIVDCYRVLAAEEPSAVLVLAPRHIERVDEVEAMVRARGIPVQRRSKLAAEPSCISPGPRVIILDSRGELASFYREAVVAYVGGTLIPVGGHNLLEPAVWSKPVLFGPYTDHCAEIASMLIEAGGGLRVKDAQDLVKQVTRLFAHAEERTAMGRAARRVVEQNQGALESTVEAIETLLPQHASGAGHSLSVNQIPLMAGR